MALSKVVEGAKAEAPVKVAAPAQQGATTSSKSSFHEEFRLRGQKIREGRSAEDKAAEGSKSDKVAFVGCLGDPNKPQPRKEGKEDKPSLTVVGYAFKALEDMMVPRANIKTGFKSLMDVEDMTEEPVKAGQTFYLNTYEAGALISRPEYAGHFTGEGESVSITLKFARDREEPLPVLKKDTKGSIKLHMIEVADMIPVEGDPKAKGTPKVKDEFADKFAVLYTKKSAGKRGGSAKAKTGEVQADLAAAFNAYIQSRK